MPVADSTYLIDLSQNVPGAVRLLRDLEGREESVATVAPVQTEVLLGAYLRGGKYLERTARLFESIEIVPVGSHLADAAARLGGRLLAKGVSLGAVDLEVAALAWERHTFVISRDPDFGRIEGLLVSRYEPDAGEGRVAR